jgi:hypothetical protein
VSAAAIASAIATVGSDPVSASRSALTCGDSTPRRDRHALGDAQRAAPRDVAVITRACASAPGRDFLCSAAPPVDLSGQENTMHSQSTRHFLIAGAALVAAAASARADAVAGAEPVHAAEPEPIDGQTVPQPCRQYLTVPANSHSVRLVWSQRLSLAQCEQGAIAAPPAAGDPSQLRGLVASLETALQPSSQIYRDAMAHGPAQIRMLAAYGLGMTAVNLMVRARSAIPPSTDRHGNLDTHSALEPLLTGHARAADTAFAEVDRLATEYPEDAAANVVVRNAVASARSHLRGRTAK